MAWQLTPAPNGALCQTEAGVETVLAIRVDSRSDATEFLVGVRDRRPVWVSVEDLEGAWVSLSELDRTGDPERRFRPGR